MPGVQVLPTLDRPQEVEELPQQLEVVPAQRHLPRDRELDPRPHEVAERVILLVVVPLRVLEPRLADEPDVGPVHPCRGVCACHVLVAVDDELHAVGFVGEEEGGDGVQASLRVLATLAVWVCKVAAICDDGVVAEPATEHARACVVALGVGRRGAEWAGVLALGILALRPGNIKGAVLLQQRLDLFQLLEAERLRPAVLRELRSEGSA
mmetsp:Transcript_100267/g.289493  ORF Transcript_100267/g.289493 Transcript_100267/m.289493 type:complete len:209 (+) Transcript_100267:871-1497(+)